MDGKGILRRFLRNHTAVAAVAFLLMLILVTLVGPYVMEHNPVDMAMQDRLKPPSWEHPFGRDNFGRDLFARMVAGSRVSLAVGGMAVAISAVVGVLLGVMGGYFGGMIDSVIMRAVDIFLAFPVILLALALVTVLGPSVQNLILALAAVFWTQYARVVRGVVLVLKEREFVMAARALGASPRRIMLRHIIPNCLAEVLVIATLGLGNAIVAEASLSFLGLGIQPPTPSWGEALSVGLQFLRQSPHMVIFPGLMIFLTVLAVNLLGDGLRDVLDPKLRS